MAATQPDAGQTVQELKAPPAPPSTTAPLTITAPTGEPTAPGGLNVAIKEITFTGNRVFSQKQLLTVLGDAEGKSYDLAGMKALADRISAYYHAEGYPFAHALVPTQHMESGTLRIDIIEGRYGTVKALGDNPRANAAAQPFLSTLTPGSVIESDPLERASLLLNDQPGYKVTPVIRPGSEFGTGDLDVHVERTDWVHGNIGVDNGGNRYTGQNRAVANLEVDSPFLFGDQFKISSLYTQENMWFGSLGYSLPVGSSGLRAHADYAHTYYELGKDFSSLDAHGTADIADAGLSYPLLRSQQANLNLGATYQHKWLNDAQGATSTSTDKSSDSVPVTLGFDLRDNLAGSAITYGALGWTHGNLDLDSALSASDATTARTAGNFDKFNLDVARLQGLPSDFSLFGRFSGQLSSHNLDSSEQFGLGGPNGVRAYPTGEGFGDEGWLAQFELRYQIDAFTPYGFYDAGDVRVNHTPWTIGNNERSVGGAGMGLRFNMLGWYADTSVAWRTYGGPPQSDTKDNDPVYWLSAGYKF